MVVYADEAEDRVAGLVRAIIAAVGKHLLAAIRRLKS